MMQLRSTLTVPRPEGFGTKAGAMPAVVVVLFDSGRARVVMVNRRAMTRWRRIMVIWRP